MLTEQERAVLDSIEKAYEEMQAVDRAFKALADPLASHDRYLEAVAWLSVEQRQQIRKRLLHDLDQRRVGLAELLKVVVEKFEDYIELTRTTPLSYAAHAATQEACN